MSELFIDQSRRCATIEGREIHLSPQEYRLLYRLACSVDQVVTKEELLAVLWSTTEQGLEPGIAATPAAVDLVVFRLRKKLADPPETPLYLETRRGFGYILHHAQILPAHSVPGSDPAPPFITQKNVSFTNSHTSQHSATPWSTLTRREWELFLLLGDEQTIHVTNKALAQRLRMAEGTLKKHLQNLYRKLDVENRSGATLLAMRATLSSS